MAEENNKSLSDRVGGVLGWGATIVCWITIALIEDLLIKPPEAMRDALRGIGVVAAIGAAILAFNALRLVDMAYKVIVYFVMAVVFFWDCFALYGLIRIWYFGLEAFGLSLSTVRGWAWFGLFLLFVMNLIVSALLIPVMRAAGIDPAEFTKS